MKLRKQIGRTERLSKSYDREAQQRGRRSKEGKLWEYKIIVIWEMDLREARDCPKKRKSLQGEAQKPCAKQASQENHQVDFRKLHFDTWQDFTLDSRKKLLVITQRARLKVYIKWHILHPVQAVPHPRSHERESQDLPVLLAIRSWSRCTLHIISVQGEDTVRLRAKRFLAWNSNSRKILQPLVILFANGIQAWWEFHQFEDKIFPSLFAQIFTKFGGRHQK